MISELWLPPIFLYGVGVGAGLMYLLGWLHDRKYKKKEDLILSMENKL